VKKIKTDQKKNRKVGPKKIIQFGEEVFSVFWDSGAPGAGAEYESVFKWRDNYAVCLSFDEPQGPYSSLVEAVKAVELNRVTEATVSIDSQELSSEQIAKMLRYFGEPPFGLRINGEIWLVDRDKKFVRKVDEDHS
jgi:hypothetical protein